MPPAENVRSPALCRDRRARPALRTIVEAFGIALDLVGEPVLVFQSESLDIVAANQAARRLLSTRRSRFLGQSIRAWGQAHFGHDFAAWLDAAMAAEGDAVPRVIAARDGQRYALELRRLPDFDNGEHLSVVVLVPQSPAADSQDRLAAGRRDPLTGLADREELVRYAESISGRQSRRGGWSALYFLDVDDFKSVNDQFGHSAGDEVLRTVAERLVECVRPSDLVIRYGGDEFVLLVGRIAAPREADKIAGRIAAALAQPFEAAGQRIEVSVSVGVALARQPVQSLQSLIDNADRSMYRAKARSRGNRPR